MAQQMCGGDAKGGEESDGRSGDARGGGKEKSREVLQPRMARHREKWGRKRGKRTLGSLLPDEGIDEISSTVADGNR